MAVTLPHCEAEVNQARDIIERVRREHIAAIDGTFDQYGDVIADIARRTADAFEAGNKVMIFGNGGSACDAMHFAGECVGRFVSDRRPLPAIALTADPGILTAIGNDYGFEEIFTRQLRAHAKPGDVAIGISTSGQSANVLAALQAGSEMGLLTVLLTGERGKTTASPHCVVAVPSAITAHIQETHITLLQLVISLVESQLFSE